MMGHRQMKNLQSASINLKAGGEIVWSVCIQTKPVVKAIPKRTISLVRRTRRLGIIFVAADVIVDMA